MKIAHLLALAATAAALCTSPVAMAQYEWLDHNGRHVYSDKLPPADIPESSILKVPRASAPARAMANAPGAGPSDTQVAAAPDAGAAGASTDGDAELEQKKQELEAAEQARVAEQEREQQARRADNCERAQRSRQTLESGMRVARVNASGERIILDDTQRAAELQHANQIIASDC